MIQMIFFRLTWKHGEESNYLFPNLYSDFIVSWEQEHGGGSIWEQTLYFSGGGIMGMGVFWRKRGDRSHFLVVFFSTKFEILLLLIKLFNFSQWHRSMGREVIIFDVVWWSLLRLLYQNLT